MGDPHFLLRKRIERRINELFPDRYIPLYALISFTNVPYAEALRQDREQRALIDRVLAIPGSWSASTATRSGTPSAA